MSAAAPAVPLTPQAEYAARIARQNEAIARGDRAHLRVSNLRLVVFLAAVAAILPTVRGLMAAGWYGAFAAAFVLLVVVHARVLDRIDRARRVRRIYERGLARIEGRWAGAGPTGARFQREDHPFARDLDLFGRASLFQLLDTARTESGEKALADWLLAPAPVGEVRARQAAVDELRSMVDFREALVIAAADVGRTESLAAWAALPPARLPAAVGLAIGACAAVTIALSAAVLDGGLDWHVLAAWVGMQALVALVWRPRTQRVLARLDIAAHDLELLATLLALIESQPFHSPRLVALRASLDTRGLPPSRRVAQLRRAVVWIDSTRNQILLPFARYLALRTQLAVLVDRWHARYGASVAGWLRAVGDLEALAGLATYAYEHPADPFPEVLDSGPVFEADDLGHPLLLESSTVRNDVRLGGGSPRVLIVSGSNMSGKSTLLRAVGVNAVLALAGAPVRAARLRVSPVALGATLRIEDSLEEGHSRFYAEILRLRAIVDIARGETPALFLLDEILGGTNSYDRRIGAEAVVKTLVAAGAIGLVTTHDLALTELAATLGGAADNVHFEDRIDEGRMVFDYRMRPGIVERSNALALMRAIGLEV